MNRSKWSYIGVGTSIMCAFVGALTHMATALIVGIIFTVYNWYMGEYSRRLEDAALVASIKESAKEDIHE